MKRKIRLTESDLHRIVKESVNDFLSLNDINGEQYPNYYKDNLRGVKKIKEPTNIYSKFDSEQFDKASDIRTVKELEDFCEGFGLIPVVKNCKSFLFRETDGKCLFHCDARSNKSAFISLCKGVESAVRKLPEYEDMQNKPRLG